MLNELEAAFSSCSLNWPRVCFVTNDSGSFDHPSLTFKISSAQLITSSTPPSLVLSQPVTKLLQTSKSRTDNSVGFASDSEAALRQAEEELAAPLMSDMMETEKRDYAMTKRLKKLGAPTVVPFRDEAEPEHNPNIDQSGTEDENGFQEVTKAFTNI